MEGLRKQVSKIGSFTDKRSEGSQDSSTRAISAKTRLSHLHLKMRVLSNLKDVRSLQRQRTTIAYENTYKLEPDSTKRFSTERAEQVIQDVFQQYLGGKTYDPEVLSRLIKTISELIKNRVKVSGLERYKIIATVTVIQNKNQGIQLSSRALWNHNFDNYASLAYEGPNYYAIGSVYAVYYD